MSDAEGEAVVAKTPVEVADDAATKAESEARDLAAKLHAAETEAMRLRRHASQLKHGAD